MYFNENEKVITYAIPYRESDLINLADAFGFLYQQAPGLVIDNKDMVLHIFGKIATAIKNASFASANPAINKRQINGNIIIDLEGCIELIPRFSESVLAVVRAWIENNNPIEKIAKYLPILLEFSNYLVFDSDTICQMWKAVIACKHESKFLPPFTLQIAA